jgi:hypothetical protein
VPVNKFGRRQNLPQPSDPCLELPYNCINVFSNVACANFFADVECFCSVVEEYSDGCAICYSSLLAIGASLQLATLESEQSICLGAYTISPSYIDNIFPTATALLSSTTGAFVAAGGVVPLPSGLSS